MIPIPSPMNSPEAGSNEENPTYSQDGVDLTLIRWMLSLSPSRTVGDTATDCAVDPGLGKIWKENRSVTDLRCRSIDTGKHFTVTGDGSIMSADFFPTEVPTT